MLRMARGSCLENMASLCCDTLMAPQEHSSGANLSVPALGSAHDGAGRLHALPSCSCLQTWPRGSFSVGSFSASSVGVKGLHDDHFQFHPLESSDN